MPSILKEKILDAQGYKKGQKSDGVLAIKELLLLAKALKIHSQGMDENRIFGDGTEKAVNGLLKSVAMLRMALQAITSSRSSLLKSERRFKTLY